MTFSFYAVDLNWVFFSTQNIKTVQLSLFFLMNSSVNQSFSFTSFSLNHSLFHLALCPPLLFFAFLFLPSLLFCSSSFRCHAFCPLSLSPFFLTLFFFFCSQCAVTLVLFPSLPLSSCPHSPSLNLGLLFAGQSQVNCVCPFSMHLCVTECVLSNEGHIRSLQLKEHSKRWAFSLFFFSLILCYSVFELR